MSEPNYTVRLQKFLARGGVASRRGSEALITDGRVKVNGETVSQLGSKINPATDKVTVDGRAVVVDGDPVYLVLNKPGGVVSTMSDPHARQTVAHLVPTDEYPGLFAVGRLDANTTGLLLFTTNGEFAHRILHPRYKVFKRYVAHVMRPLRDGELRWLRDGVMLEDGITAPALVERIAVDERVDPPVDIIQISIREGRKRQVRRMFDTMGHPVIALERTAFGPVELGDLKSGSWRELTSDERQALLDAVGMADC